LPEREELKIPIRHLGLHQGCKQEETFYEKWADHVEENLNIEEILNSIPKQVDKANKAHQSRFDEPPESSFSVVIAKDYAFQFLYPDTVDMLELWGGTIKYFSPLEDSSIPTGVDWVYLPGGYPELFGEELSRNKALLNDLSQLVDSGLPIVAECDGLIYLGKTLLDGSNRSWPMAGILDFTTTLEKPRMTLGYRKICIKNILETDEEIRGHEFHSSLFVELKENLNCETFNRQFVSHFKDGIIKGNVFAFYSHIY
jgi:cobyrinic acid a,c-diamide synthase